MNLGGRIARLSVLAGILAATALGASACHRAGP